MDSNNHKDFSREYQLFYEALISDSDSACFGRAREDVPPDLMTVLSGEELELAKKELYAKLEASNEYRSVYIRALMSLNDKQAIPVIKKMLCNIKEWKKHTQRSWSFEIAECKAALKKLKKQK